MRNLLLIPALISSLLSFGQHPAKTATSLALQNIIQDAGLTNGSLSFLAVNLDNGKVISDHYGSKSMVPASIQKVITTAVAIENLGPNFQFETIIAADANKESGLIQGDLYVFGSGDPTLQSSHYTPEKSPLIRVQEALKPYAGFNGNLIIDASIFNEYTSPRGWIWEDMGNYFGAAPTAIMWEDNLLEVYLNSGQAGSRVMLSPKTEKTNYKIDVQVKAAESNRDDAWFFSAPGSDVIYATGTIPAHKSNFKVKASHPDPMKNFGFDVLNAIGQTNKEVRIDYDYVEHGGLKPLLTLNSPPLYSIVRITNMHSINLYAEALNIQLDSAKRYKTVEGGIAATERYLKSQKIGLKGTRLMDGSGLSPLNRMTCQTMVDVLTMMYRSKNKDAFMNSLPVAGQSGTIAGYFKGTKLEGNLKAKSGTMTGVRNYTGYFTNKDGHTIAFCIMMNDYDENKKSELMKKIEELLLAIIEA